MTPCFRYFACVWGKKSARKHKKWEGDGLLRVANTTALLIDEEGKELGRGSGYKTAQLQDLEDGGRYKIEIERLNHISKLLLLPGWGWVVKKWR